MKTIFIILSFYSLSFLLKESFIFDKPRSWLINKYVFFYKLFSCYYCLGIHCGYILYFSINSVKDYNLHDFILWSLTSGIVSFIFDLIVSKLLLESSLIKKKNLDFDKK